MSTESPGFGLRSRWWIAWLSVAVLAVAAVWLFSSKPSRTTGSILAERSRNVLELRDGVLLDQGKPFTGFVLEHHDDGSLKSRSSVSNGLLEGLSQGWHANGKLQVSETYVRGISHGIRTKYHESGAKLSTVEVVHGQTQGIFERWFENGRLSERVELTNGVPHGESLAFHPDGSLKARVRMNQGEVVENRFWAPGEHWPE